MNQAQIHLRLASDSLDAPIVRVEIEHSMPNLDHLTFKLGEALPWTRYDGPIQWPIQFGRNVIEAKPVSQYGREGYTSRIVLRFLRGSEYGSEGNNETV